MSQADAMLYIFFCTPVMLNEPTIAQIVPFSILIGLVVPIPFWLIHQRFPKFGANKVVTPILCCKPAPTTSQSLMPAGTDECLFFNIGTLGYLSVGINSSVFTTFCLAVFSQYYLRRYSPRWFRKYNFLLSAALDGGTQVMVFVYTFSVGGGSGEVVNMPIWALVRFNLMKSLSNFNNIAYQNPVGNPDYCKRLT
jgi:hypothetical protein